MISDWGATARSQSQVEAQARAANRDVGGLDQHPARVRLPLAGDMPHPRSLLTGLTHPRVKPEVADEMARRREPLDITDDA